MSSLTDSLTDTDKDHQKSSKSYRKDHLVIDTDFDQEDFIW